MSEDVSDTQYPSGKPNEHSHTEDDDEDNPVQPIMTYSILDQSILNWPSIQDWAQKQWVKRQNAGLPGEENATASRTDQSQLNNSLYRRGMILYLHYSSIFPSLNQKFPINPKWMDNMLFGSWANHMRSDLHEMRLSSHYCGIFEAITWISPFWIGPPYRKLPFVQNLISRLPYVMFRYQAETQNDNLSREVKDKA